MSLHWIFSEKSSDSDSEEQVQNIYQHQKKTGCLSLHRMHKGLVPCVEAFIQQNTAVAHFRRRDRTMYMNGITLAEIKRHVETKFGIKISRSTIHRVMRPRRHGTGASERFKSLLNACIPPKNNSGDRSIHPDFHYTCSQVNLVRMICHSGTLQMSVDNKNRIDLGTLAVNRRCQINRFHLVPDAPIYNNHDFPYRNSRLTPAGY